MNALLEIQQELNAPKNLRNDYAGFNYRNAEAMLTMLKPMLKRVGATLTLNDEIINVGNSNYIKATVILTDKDGKEYKTTACAREMPNKTKMDDPQITGVSSSYARKYALCGLFAVDDGRNDPDSNEYQKRTRASQPAKVQPVKTDAKLLENLKNAKTKEELSVAYNALGGNKSASKEIKILTGKLFKQLQNA